MFNVSVKDLVFENCLKEELSNMVKNHVRVIQKAKTPELHKKISELNKEQKKAKEERDFYYAHELQEKIDKLREEIRERTPGESMAIDNLSQKVRELRRQRRQYYRVIIPKETVVMLAKKVIENPEKVFEIIEGVTVVVGKGAMGA